MEGLKMKYFVLKPKSNTTLDLYAKASRLAMIAYANSIKETNSELAVSLERWAVREQNIAHVKDYDKTTQENIDRS